MAVAARERAETQFRAMGTDVRVVVLDAPSGVIDLAAGLVESLEAKWSRFRPDSELCRLNAAAGMRVVVSPETFAVIERAVLGWRETGGRYDPTVLDAVVSAGYDRDFALVPPTGPLPAPATPSPGCSGVELDRVVRTVMCPPGVTLDLGGIGKGYAADLVAEALVDVGAAGALVSLGGDLRVIGEPPRAEGWVIDVEDPVDERDLGVLHVVDGAVATSTRVRRAWQRGGQAMHHLVDPSTGSPAASGLASVTVVAAEAWWADVMAKAAFVCGPEEAVRVLETANVTGLFVRDDGTVRECAGVEAFR